jgi:hypothetical protein
MTRFGITPVENLVAAIGKRFASDFVNMVDQGYSPGSVTVMDTLWSLQEGNDEGPTGRDLEGLHELDDGDDDQDFVPAVLRTDDDRRTTR